MKKKWDLFEPVRACVEKNIWWELLIQVVQCLGPPEASHSRQQTSLCFIIVRGNQVPPPFWLSRKVVKGKYIESSQGTFCCNGAWCYNSWGSSWNASSPSSSFKDYSQHVTGRSLGPSWQTLLEAFRASICLWSRVYEQALWFYHHHGVIPSWGAAPPVPAALPGSPPWNDGVYQIGFCSNQNDVTPRKAASNPEIVLFHNNRNFGNAMHFSTSPKIPWFFSPSFPKIRCSFSAFAPEHLDLSFLANAMSECKFRIFLHARSSTSPGVTKQKVLACKWSQWILERWPSTHL
jgi:hypothetical protein